MTLLPIAMRELRAASRRPSTYWVRTGAALVFFIIAVWVFTVGHNEQPTQLAELAFGMLAGTAGLLCLMSGLRYTADCISEEKRQGTLGLLFLTDLSGMDVVAGKLAASSLHALHSMLAVIPIIALPLLLGGISGFQVARVSLAALNLLFFSLSVGLLASSLHQEAKKSASLTLLILLSITFVIPAAGGLLYSQARIGMNGLWALLAPSPGFTFAAAFDVLFTPSRFWVSFALVHIMAWAALLLACWVTPRSWQDQPSKSGFSRLKERFLLWLNGTANRQGGERTQMLELSPYYWISARHKPRRWSLWLVLALLTIVWFGLLLKYRADWFNEGVYIGTALLLNIILKGWAVTEVGRQIAEDRQSGTMELLLSTPMTIADFLRGQYLAFVRQFAGAAAFVGCVFCIFAVLTLKAASSTEEQTTWLLFWLGLTAMLVVDLWATYWIGLADGLCYGNPHRASSVTFTRVLAVPWVAFGFLLFSMVATGSSSNTNSPVGILLLWFFTGLSTNIAFVARARKLLLQDFRAIACQPVAARQGWVKRMLGLGFR